MKPLKRRLFSRLRHGRKQQRGPKLFFAANSREATRPVNIGRLTYPSRAKEAKVVEKRGTARNNSHQAAGPAPCRRRNTARPCRHGRTDRGLFFSPEDTTAGAETELQAVLLGKKNDVDLPLMIEQSNYLANIMRRAASGDAPRKLGGELVRFLNEGGRNVWENSWVRFPKVLLKSFCPRHVLKGDLRPIRRTRRPADRSDIGKFSFVKEGIEYLRVPVSYLVKLALADAVGAENVHPIVRRTGVQLLEHFVSDNTSPETHSFYIVHGAPGRGPGRELARETAKRFLLTRAPRNVRE